MFLIGMACPFLAGYAGAAGDAAELMQALTASISVSLVKGFVR
jgi:hypothetical protein